MSMRQGCWGVLVVCACGARSQIAGSDDEFDASFDAASADVVIHADGSPSGDSGDGGTDTSFDACIPVTVATQCAGPQPDECADYGCKFDIEWSCGDTKYRVGGACGPATNSGWDSAVFEGVCDENGKQTSSFNTPASSCPCDDASALVTIAREKCTHQ
jgi:hypothetical protein